MQLARAAIRLGIKVRLHSSNGTPKIAVHTLDSDGAATYLGHVSGHQAYKLDKLQCVSVAPPLITMLKHGPLCAVTVASIEKFLAQMNTSAFSNLVILPGVDE